MTNRLFKIVGAASLLAAAFSIHSFADVITSVSFEAGCDTEAAISSGAIESPVFAVNDPNAGYELSSYSDVSNSEAFKTARTYELVFEAIEGNTFPKADQIQVTGKGITEITKKSVDKDNDTTLTVRVKAYPYYAWPAPEVKEGDLSSKKISWERPSGATTEYLISWVNQSGETRQVHSSTSSASLTISNYNKAYTGSKTDEYSDAYIEGIALRLKGSAGSNPHTAPGEWQIIGSISPDDFSGIETYDNWGDLFSGVTGVVSTNTAGGSSGGSGGPGSVKLNGWQSQNGVWYYYENSIPHKGWILDGGLWYYMNPSTGVMETGWIIDGGKRYYLNPNVGGPQGSMVTGTQVIDGATCTFDASGALVSQQ